MFHTLPDLFASAAMQRMVLLVNHVLASEPIAAERLLRHAGRRLRVHLKGWPEMLPAPPHLLFAITPAGLIEWLADSNPDADTAAELEITVDAANPARALLQGLLGQRPAVGVAGDAAMATDVSWVIDNLRWDIRDDLARIVGELPAGELARSARALAQGLRTAVQGLVQRAASSPAEPPVR